MDKNSYIESYGLKVKEVYPGKRASSSKMASLLAKYITVACVKKAADNEQKEC